MKTHRLSAGLGVAGALWLAGSAEAMAGDALPDFLFPFPPPTNSSEQTPIPLREPSIQSDASPSQPDRLLRSKTAPVVFGEGDRVLFLGDQLLRGELDYGYFETRLTCQYPDTPVTFRNLSWLTNHPLGRPDSADHPDSPDAWLDDLLNRVARIRPTIVFLGFGTDAATAGEPGLNAFRANLGRLIDGVLTMPDHPPPKLVIMNPLSHALASASATDAVAEEEEAKLALYAQLLWQVASDRQCEFIDLHNWSRLLVRAARAVPEPDQIPARTQLEDGLVLTQYGYWCMAPVLEWALHFTPNNWRFGYLADSTLRDGQFGIHFTQRSRSGTHVTANIVEDRLPTPAPPGIPETDPTPRPRSYIQITGLEPGDYVMRVDGESIVKGTEADWARYGIISQGPSWNQAERLRQAIVRKNAHLLSAWRSDRKLETSDDPADLRLAELEAEIATLRKPVPHTYQLHLVGADPVPLPSELKGPRIRRPTPRG